MFKTNVRTGILLGPAVRTQDFTAVGADSVPGTKITQATWCDRKQTAKKYEETGTRYLHLVSGQHGTDSFRLFSSLKSWDLGLSRMKALQACEG